ncbi:MAG: hypothetical protein ACRBCI_16190, partial [Cellvibrionaceae bacterium]
MFKGLAAKFSLGVFIITGFLFTVYATYDYYSISKRLHAEQDSRIQLIASGVLGTVSEALWGYDEETLKSALESNGSASGVAVIGIHDGKELLYAFRHNDDNTTEEIKDVDISLPGIKKFPITYNDDGEVSTLGDLFFLVDSSEITAELSRFVWTSIAKTLFSIVALVGMIVMFM